jgi:hypothetical protein
VGKPRNKRGMGKMNKVQSNTRDILFPYSKTFSVLRATLKATLFLMPLFGVQIVIITNRNIVTSKDCQAEDIYYYISYLVEGLQGVMVAILFCYINQEVRLFIFNQSRTKNT